MAFFSYNHSGMLAIRSASGHQTARKRTSQSIPSLSRASINPSTARQTSGNRTCRLRPQRPVSSRNSLCTQSEGRKLEYSYRRPVTLRHKRAFRPRRLLQAGSMELRLGTADWGRVQPGQGSIAWSASFLWKNIVHRQRKADFTRTAGSGRVAFSVTEARLFGPALFESTKLKTFFLGIGQEQHPTEDGEGRRTYTLTHSDVTSKLTLAVAKEFNKAQFGGWYSRLQRDEILAVWRVAKTRGGEEGLLEGEGEETRMELHVHCHISGGHVLLNFIAQLRFWIFRKELPVVLEAFRHGDRVLFEKHPALEYAPVWVHFHSTCKDLHQRECWGPLITAAQVGAAATNESVSAVLKEMEASGGDGDDSWPDDVASKIRGAQLIPTPVFLKQPPE